MRLGRAFPNRGRQATRRAKPIVTQPLAANVNTASSMKASVALTVGLSAKLPMSSSMKETLSVPHIAVRPVEDIFGGLAGVVAWAMRYDIVDNEGNKQDELHPYAVGNITWDPSNRIQRILDGVKIDPTEVSKLTRGVSRIQPVFTIESIGHERTMGRFTYFGGSKITIDGKEWVDCAPLWDRCYQLEQAARQPMGINAGTLLTTAFTNVATAGAIPPGDIDISSSTGKLGAQPLSFASGSGKTRMSLLRQVASLMSFLPPGFSQADRLVSRPVPQPDDEWPTFVYADGENATITGGSLTENTSVADRPNVYQVLSSQPSSVALAGEYLIPNTFENSVSNLGGIEVVASKTIDGFETGAQCDAAAKAWAQQDYAVVQVIEWDCDIPDPRHDQWDVCEVNGLRLLESWHQFDCMTGRSKHRAKKVYVDALT